MKKVLLLIMFVLSLAGCGGKDSAKQTARDRSAEPTVVGNWLTTIAPRDGVSFEVYLNLNHDGTAVMGSDNAPERKHLDNVKWSRNGDNIYLYMPGETEVGVFEILSLDDNSLVVHCKGEPEKEIIYFTRQ